jgi:hypothetical protein
MTIPIEKMLIVETVSVLGFCLEVRQVSICTSIILEIPFVVELLARPLRVVQSLSPRRA